MSAYSVCKLLTLVAPFVLLSISAARAQSKALPESVFTAALDTARIYADDRTLINFCMRSSGEVGHFSTSDFMMTSSKRASACNRPAGVWLTSPK